MLHHLQPARGEETPEPSPALPEQLLHHRVRVFPAPVEDREHLDPVFAVPVLQHVDAVERYRAVGLHDQFGGPAPRPHPSGELLRVGDRRRQVHELNVGGEVDDHLLPHRAAIPVLEVVHLVEDDDAERPEPVRVGVDHVAEHLRRHHDDSRIAVDHVVAGEEPDGIFAIHRPQVAELLVGQRLDRRRVEGSLAPAAGEGDRRLRNQRLACPGRCRHHHGGALFQVGDRLALERVRNERQVRHELVEHPRQRTSHRFSPNRTARMVSS